MGLAHFIKNRCAAMLGSNLQLPRNMMFNKLSEKGISEETIDMAYDQFAEVENTELKAAENFIRKKLGTRLSMVTDDENEDILPYEEKQKLMAAAFRKGFRQDSIRTALKNLNVDT